MGLGRLRGSKPPPEIIGSHEMKDGKWIPSSWKDLLLPPLWLLTMKFCLSPSFCFSTYSFVHVKKKWPPENPRKHSYFHRSTFSTASAVYPPTNALNKVTSAFKGPLLGQERWQSLHAFSACVLLMEHAVEHHMSSVRWRPILQNPQKLLSWPAPWAVLVHKHTAAVSSEVKQALVL